MAIYARVGLITTKHYPPFALCRQSLVTSITTSTYLLTTGCSTRIDINYLLNPSYPGGGIIIILCRKIAISLDPNLRWTSDLSVNTSLSVAVQEKKNRALYLSRLKRGGPMKFENTFFQIAKLRFSSIFVDFRQISRIFKKFSGDQFKS